MKTFTKLISFLIISLFAINTSFAGLFYSPIFECETKDGGSIVIETEDDDLLIHYDEPSEDVYNKTIRVKLDDRDLFQYPNSVRYKLEGKYKLREFIFYYVNKDVQKDGGSAYFAYNKNGGIWIECDPETTDGSDDLFKSGIDGIKYKG